MNFEAKGVVVRYRPELDPALDGVTATVPAGSFYGIIGPNGSGKSTLMRALLGATALEAGSVSFEGKRVSMWTRASLARRVGAVPQGEAVAFPVTVREMVGMGRYPHLGPFRFPGPDDRRAVDEALGECGLEAVADRDLGQLSGGEAQRVRIARALAQRPDALVLDEPTANLDLRHEMEILRLLRARADAGRTVILITHRLNVAARFADRLLLLNRGRVAGEGAPAEVLTREILEPIYDWPLAVDRDPVTGAPRVVPT